VSVTDAERAFYESVIDDPTGKSIQDLRYAYFLAAVDGGLPSGPVAVPDGIEATGTPSASTYLRGDGSWSTPPDTTYSSMPQAEAQNPNATGMRVISGQRLHQGVAAFFRAIPGYSESTAQVLEHDDTGSLVWTTKV